VATAAHDARVGDGERIAHVGTDGIGGDIGILGSRREVRGLVVIVGTAHLRDRRRELGAQVLLLLLLERIQRPHAGEGEGAAAARRAVAVWFTNLLLVVGRRIVVRCARQRWRRIGSRAGISSGLARLAGRLLLLLLLLLLLALRVRHRRRRGGRAVQVRREVRAVTIAVRHDGDGRSVVNEARWDRRIPRAGSVGNGGRCSDLVGGGRTTTKKGPGRPEEQQ